MTTDDGMGTQNQPQEADSPGPSNIQAQQDSSVINPKVPAAAVGGGVGVALADILVYTLEQIPGVADIPTHIEIATGVVVVAILGALAGYFTRSR